MRYFSKISGWKCLANHPVCFILCIVSVVEHLRSLHACYYCQTLTQNTIIFYKLYCAYIWFYDEYRE